MVAAVDIEGGISSAWESIVVFAPKFLGFLAILIVGYFVAKLVAGLVDKLLARVGFDRWVERGALREPLQKSSLEASDVMGRIAFWGLFLIALQLAFGVFGPNPVSNLLEGFIAYLPKVFVAVLIVVIAAAVAKVVTELLTATLAGVSGGHWIARGAGIAILVVGIFAALNQLEIAPEIVNGLFYATLAIIVGSAIVAVGGGGIQTMRGYWERASRRVEDKGREVEQKADPEAARARVEDMAGKADPNGEHTIDLRDQAETRPY
jgi:mechanosensitive ion channel-like protein